MRYDEFFHYRWITDDKQTEKMAGPKFYPKYYLGQSNITALARGGVTVSVFLAHEGKLFAPETTMKPNELLWVVNPVSHLQNYCKERAREDARLKISIKGRPTVITSKNYEYFEVKKIASWLANEVDKLCKIIPQKNQLWKTLKTDPKYNIDKFISENPAENKQKSIDAVVKAEPLTIRLFH